MEDNPNAEMLENTANQIKARYPANPALGEIADLLVMEDRFRRSENYMLSSQIQDTNDMLKDVQVALSGNGKVEGSMQHEIIILKKDLVTITKIAEEAALQAEDNTNPSEKGMMAFKVLVWMGVVAGGAVIAKLLDLIIKAY